MRLREPCTHRTACHIPSVTGTLQIKPVHDKLMLHKRVNEKETLVGWYSSWSEESTKSAAAAAASAGASASGPRIIDEMTVVVHEFFARLIATGPMGAQVRHR